MTGSPTRTSSSLRVRVVVSWFLVGGLAVYGLTALLVSIFEHKIAARVNRTAVISLDENVVEPAEWGKNYPLQYSGFLKTTSSAKTRFGGTKIIKRAATADDPRTEVAESKLEKEPRLKTIWAGYAFAKDYREKRGHAYMSLDQRETQRVKIVNQPGTCLHCHASMSKVYLDLGKGDMVKGFSAVEAMDYKEASGHPKHPISCNDCHDPKTMDLRITRQSFVEGITALKKGQGIDNYDVHTMATHQEMRSFVCAQCHVEYYFRKGDRHLVFPWSKGLRADDMVAYYEDLDFKDWTHATTKAPMLKAQHPEFELWSQGIHASAGVSCADCHMPYQRVGASKVSDHHIRSPLLTINNSCQTCHKVPEAQLRGRIETIQVRTQEMQDLALGALVDLIADIDAAQKAGAPMGKLDKARSWHRKAQFLADYVVSENSRGAHAGQEAVRVLGKSIDFCRKGQKALR